MEGKRARRAISLQILDPFFLSPSYHPDRAQSYKRPVFASFFQTRKHGAAIAHVRSDGRPPGARAEHLINSNRFFFCFFLGEGPCFVQYNTGRWTPVDTVTVTSFARSSVESAWAVHITLLHFSFSTWSLVGASLYGISSLGFRAVRDSINLERHWL
ncbi:unnamed protein product [Periconia digitata]|uniref:Uncharacterized protein n=1 Tax=Periconia digitata TaxID=1303443 RepID=A0A9W4XQK9_9PLEO|nr:unnamed protein product [Periconia digitata]